MMIRTTVESTRLREAPFPETFKPTWSLGYPWSRIARTLIHAYAEE